MNTTCVIASYKYGHLAAHAIESVLSQTRRPDEIIVVDDGVGDVAPLRDLYAGEKITWLLREKNLGTVNNFNDVLFNHVETDRVLFLGADNYLRPDTFQLLRLFDSHDIVSYDIALFGTQAEDFAKLVNADANWGGFKIWRFKECDMEQRNWIHGSSLYNVNFAKVVGGYCASGNANSEEDWMLWRAMLKMNASHFHFPEPLLYYRRHKNNFTNWGEKTT